MGQVLRCPHILWKIPMVHRLWKTLRQAFCLFARFNWIAVFILLLVEMIRLNWIA